MNCVEQELVIQYKRLVSRQKYKNTDKNESLVHENESQVEEKTRQGKLGYDWKKDSELGEGRRKRETIPLSLTMSAHKT